MMPAFTVAAPQLRWITRDYVAIQVTDGIIEVVSEGNWKNFLPMPFG
jgi:hypothetical protein